MKYSKTVFMYICCALVIIFIMIYTMQLRGSPKYAKLYDHNDSVVIRANDNTSVIRQYNLYESLYKLYEDIKKHKEGTCIINDSYKYDNQHDLKHMLDESIMDLRRFINADPSNGEKLCLMDITAEEQLTYNDVINERYDKTDKDSNTTKLRALCKNLALAIRLLRSRVCNWGYLNVDKLYRILEKLQKNKELTNVSCIGRNIHTHFIMH